MVSRKKRRTAASPMISHGRQSTAASCCCQAAIWSRKNGGWARSIVSAVWFIAKMQLFARRSQRNLLCRIVQLAVDNSFYAILEVCFAKINEQTKLQSR